MLRVKTRGLEDDVFAHRWRKRVWLPRHEVVRAAKRAYNKRFRAAGRQETE